MGTEVGKRIPTGTIGTVSKGAGKDTEVTTPKTWRGCRAAQRRHRRGVRAVAVVTTVLLITAASCSRQPPTTAILISADERSEAAFFPDLATPRDDSQVVPIATRSPTDTTPDDGNTKDPSSSDDSGSPPSTDLSELYDMSISIEAVDGDALREALEEARDADLTRWASASGVAPEHVGDYVSSLIPVWTTQDMVLAEHLPEGDGATVQVVIYEAGSPMLVRPDGTPAVGGNSGNPLSPGPDPSAIDETEGRPWEGFDLDRVVKAPEPRRDVELSEPTTTTKPTTTSTTATTTTTTEKRPRFGRIDPQDMQWAVEVIKRISERVDEPCVSFDIMASDRASASLAFREHADGGDCGGDSLSTAYLIEFDQLVTSGAVCGDCEGDATGERDSYMGIVERFDQSWWVDVPRTLITGDSDCGLRGTRGDEIRLVARQPIDCDTASRIFATYMASDDMQGSSAFADVEDFTCWVDLIPDPRPGDVTGACEGPRGTIEMQIP